MITDNWYPYWPRKIHTTTKYKEWFGLWDFRGRWQLLSGQVVCVLGTHRGKTWVWEEFYSVSKKFGQTIRQLRSLNCIHTVVAEMHIILIKLKNTISIGHHLTLPKAGKSCFFQFFIIRLWIVDQSKNFLHKKSLSDDFIFNRTIYKYQMWGSLGS